ncbi:MAG: hypothetical protein GY756_12845 [bacterium]|nr:hypothetical protein [bacterium]
MQYSQTIRFKTTTFTLLENSLKVDKNGSATEILYSDLKLVRVQKMPDQTSLLLFSSSGKVKIIEFTKSREEFKTFLKEFHKKTSSIEKIRFRKGHPLLFGVCIFVTTLLLAILCINIFSTTGTATGTGMPSLGIIIINIPIIYFGLTKARSVNYDPKDYI